MAIIFESGTMPQTLASEVMQNTVWIICVQEYVVIVVECHRKNNKLLFLKFHSHSEALSGTGRATSNDDLVLHETSCINLPIGTFFCEKSCKPLTRLVLVQNPFVSSLVHSIGQYAFSALNMDYKLVGHLLKVGILLQTISGPIGNIQ